MKKKRTLFNLELRGLDPGFLSHNATHSFNKAHPTTRKIAEISKKKDITLDDEILRQQLECERSCYMEKGNITIPANVVRAGIETAARTLRQGPKVRRGLWVSNAKLSFLNDDWSHKKLFSTSYENGGLMHSVPVKVKQNRLLRTRALLQNWIASYTVSVNPEHVDEVQLDTWLHILSDQIGIGDWRPDKSGEFGRFDYKLEEK